MTSSARIDKCFIWRFIIFSSLNADVISTCENFFTLQVSVRPFFDMMHSNAPIVSVLWV